MRTRSVPETLAKCTLVALRVGPACAHPGASTFLRTTKGGILSLSGRIQLTQYPHRIPRVPFSDPGRPDSPCGRCSGLDRRGWTPARSAHPPITSRLQSTFALSHLQRRGAAVSGTALSQQRCNVHERLWPSRSADACSERIASFARFDPATAPSATGRPCHRIKVQLDRGAAREAVRVRAMSKPSIWLSRGWWIFLLASCSASDKPKTQVLDAGADASLEAGDAAISGNETVPTNGSFDTAHKLANGQVVQQPLLSDSQVDYYSFQVQAGKFYVMSTDRNVLSPNNVITLFDPDRQQIAENDDGAVWPNDAVDARLVVRLDRTGRYFAKVEDRTTAAKLFIEPYTYQFSVREIESNTTGFALEMNDRVPNPVELGRDSDTGYSYVTLIGELSDSDEDTFQIQGAAGRAMIGKLLQAGTDGNGSTADSLTVSVLDADQHMLASIDQAGGQASFKPPLDDAGYRVRIQAHGSVGEHAFYAINLALLDDYPNEVADDANGDSDGAEPIELVGMFGRDGRILDRLPHDDIDYFRFEPVKGEQLTVVCEAESVGSGVRSLRAEVLDPSNQSLAVQTEDSTTILIIESLPIGVTGTHYLRLSSETPGPSDDQTSADLIEPWSRCELITR
jgi:hypothetical protein